jgi:hypothetical protein
MYGFLKLGPFQTGTGLAQTDLDQIASHLALVSRRDGLDRGDRHSTWLLYQKQEPL